MLGRCRKVQTRSSSSKFMPSNVRIIPTNKASKDQPSEWIEVHGNSDKDIMQTLQNNPVLMEKFEKATDSILEIKLHKDQMAKYIKQKGLNTDNISEFYNDKELKLMRTLMQNLLIKYGLLVGAENATKEPLAIFGPPGRFAQMVSGSIPLRRVGIDASSFTNKAEAESKAEQLLANFKHSFKSMFGK